MDMLEDLGVGIPYIDRILRNPGPVDQLPQHGQDDLGGSVHVAVIPIVFDGQVLVCRPRMDGIDLDEDLLPR